MPHLPDNISFKDFGDPNHKIPTGFHIGVNEDTGKKELLFRGEPFYIKGVNYLPSTTNWDVDAADRNSVRSRATGHHDKYDWGHPTSAVPAPLG